MENIKPNKRHFCYLLHSPSTNRTYFGYTIDPYQRLRKHNGEIAGGAKRTRKGRPWKLVCYIADFPIKNIALQFEWKNNHPTKGNRRKKKGYSIPGLKKGYLLEKKIENLTRILAAPKWTGNSVDANTIPLCVYWFSLEKRLLWTDIGITKPNYVCEKWLLQL